MRSKLPKENGGLLEVPQAFVGGIEDRVNELYTFMRLRSSQDFLETLMKWSK